MTNIHPPVAAVGKLGDSQDNVDAVLDQLWGEFEKTDSSCVFLNRLKIGQRVKRFFMAFEIIVFIVFLSVLTSGTAHITWNLYFSITCLRLLHPLQWLSILRAKRSTGKTVRYRVYFLSEMLCSMTPWRTETCLMFAAVRISGTGFGGLF